MARLGITFDMVEAAAQRLVKKEIAITMENIRKELGNTGSYTVIHKHLSKIKFEIETKSLNKIMHFEMSPDFKYEFEKSAAIFWSKANKELKLEFEKKQEELQTFYRTKLDENNKDIQMILSNLQKAEESLKEKENLISDLNEKISFATVSLQILEKKLLEKEADWKSQLERASLFQAQVQLLKEQFKVGESN